MANDMSGAFIAFDEASKIDKLLALYMPNPMGNEDLFFFPKEGKIGKLSKAKPSYDEMTCTVNVDLAQIAPSSIDIKEVYKTMQQMMEYQEQRLYVRREREAKTVPTKKAYEILKTPDDWVQKSVRTMNSIGGIAYCILGALMEKWGVTNVHHINSSFAADCHKVAEIIRNDYGYRTYLDDKSVIAYWNDDPMRNFNDVQMLLRKADV